MATLRKRNVTSARTPKFMVDGKIKWLSRDNISGAIRFSIVTDDDSETGFIVTLTKDEIKQLSDLHNLP